MGENRGRKGKDWSIRRRVVGGLLGLLFGRPQNRAKLRPEEVNRVLLLRYDRLGDAVVTTPVIEQLWGMHPGIEIDILGSPHNAKLLEADHRVHTVHNWDGATKTLPGTIRACRARNYDLTLQLILNRTTNPAIIAGLCTPRGRVVGKGHLYNRRLFDHMVGERSSLHFADQTFDVLLDGVDFGQEEPTPPPYSIDLPEETKSDVRKILKDLDLEPKKFLLLNGSAGAVDRSLGVENGTKLAQGLQEICEKSGLKLAVSGGPEESAKIKAIAEGSDATMIRFPSILHLCAGIAEAALLVTPDTGPVHIASATGTPVVAYYSEHDKPEGWAPRGVENAVVTTSVHGDVETAPVEEILRHVEKMSNVEFRMSS